VSAFNVVKIRHARDAERTSVSFHARRKPARINGYQLGDPQLPHEMSWRFLMNVEDEFGQLTQLIRRAADGDKAAEAEFCELVYDELRAEARRLKRRRDPGSLATTDLVNEFFLRLLHHDSLAQMRNRRYFFSVVADQMRKILVDHARRRHALKRGGNFERSPLDEVVDRALDVGGQRAALHIEALERPLERVERESPRQSEVAKLRFYGGRTVPEIAEVLEVSVSTVERDWRLVRAKLFAELTGRDP
jgi:RNA polymerase sigma factor (TIGR02999 family)